VHDVRRRRQLLVVRRLLVGFLTGLVLIFGFVTQFSSLATFAGFITAGIAVGLQTILLSVAAYFFIIGRFGIKVGDRISIGAVTGDVVEVGIVRFYVMEMAGSGTDLYATGRVAVFSNAVLFQAGTPLFKQMPGTQYAWHELTVKLSQDADYRAAVQEITKALQGVYDGYRDQVERQHRKLELWMDSGADLPGIQSNLLLVDGGLQFWVRFPVIIRQAAAVDEKMTEALLHLMASDPKVKAAVSGAPVIKAAVKG
jgi:small-conductance mechanosensitive channel